MDFQATLPQVCDPFFFFIVSLGHLFCLFSARIGSLMLPFSFNTKVTILFMERSLALRSDEWKRVLIVRNPFSRLASGFLDKVKENYEPRIW